MQRWARELEASSSPTATVKDRSPGPSARWRWGARPSTPPSSTPTRAVTTPTTAARSASITPTRWSSSWRWTSTPCSVRLGPRRSASPPASTSDGAVVSKTVAAVLQACGFDAASHHDAHYDVILPPLAVRAGLGRARPPQHPRRRPLRQPRPHRRGDHQPGARPRRPGGPRGRPLLRDLPQVRRELPLPRPLDGRQGERSRRVRSGRRTSSAATGYWRTVGTDCGICMAVCPFSHRDTAFHGWVRHAVRRAPWAHRMAVWFDDLVYGRRWNPAGPSRVKRV